MENPVSETPVDPVKEEPDAPALVKDELMAHWKTSVRVAVPALGGMVLAFYNDNVYLYNDTDRELTMKQGMVVAQFFRGKWVTGFQNADADVKQNSVPFCLTGSDDLVMVGPQVFQLGKVMEEARLKDPLKAKLAYHDLITSPVEGGLFAFTATLKHQHAWRSEAGDVQPSVGGAIIAKPCAGWVPHCKWKHASTALTWIMKWAQKGLSPVRPVVVMARDMTFKPKEYIEF